MMYGFISSHPGLQYVLFLYNYPKVYIKLHNLEAIMCCVTFDVPVILKYCHIKQYYLCI